ncbi:unnamed protein product [Durusdinium trenchii]|uniref:DOT1 domain-containing protein n=1 Tax=Durusdinium trenchii TaxID=1381693 RepID=A0ABP0SW88_9DINO
MISMSSISPTGAAEFDLTLRCGQGVLRREVDRVLNTYWRGREGYAISAKEERRINRGDGNPGLYGELAPEGARRLAEEWGLCEGGKAVATFADLGSGVGKLVVQSYLEWPGVHRALGVELSATRAKRALEAWEALLLSDEAFELRQMALNLAGDNDATPNPAEEVKLLHGDLLDADLSDVTHAYVSSLCFPESLIFDVSLKLKQAPRLRAVASLQPLNLDSGARLLALPTSWTSRRGMGTIAHFYDLG